MIEVQIRRPCSERAKPVFVGIHWHCPDCGASSPSEYMTGKMTLPIAHRPIIEWLPLERAVQLAHEEAARFVSAQIKTEIP